VDARERITSARLAIGACSPVPERLPALETALAGRPLAAAQDMVAHEHFAHLTPIDDIRASAAYRAEAAVVTTRDLLAQLISLRQRAA
jgi:xanthine dehydrogenase small subunit